MREWKRKEKRQATKRRGSEMKKRRQERNGGDRKKRVGCVCVPASGIQAVSHDLVLWVSHLCVLVQVMVVGAVSDTPWDYLACFVCWCLEVVALSLALYRIRLGAHHSCFVLHMLVTSCRTA